jgi:hypothetical protein
VDRFPGAAPQLFTAGMTPGIMDKRYKQLLTSALHFFFYYTEAQTKTGKNFFSFLVILSPDLGEFILGFDAKICWIVNSLAISREKNPIPKFLQ